MRILILGGARSGKSRYAENLAEASGREVVYIATATAGDEEMQTRIDHHRAQRPAHWLTVEEPQALAETLQTHAAEQRFLLVDCLTLWLSNLLAEDEPLDIHTAHKITTSVQVEPVETRPSTNSGRTIFKGRADYAARLNQERSALLETLPKLPGTVCLVSNEVGLGIVPLNPLARRFVDESGRLHQDLAAICEQVVWITAGLPQFLKQNT
jgi:adenosylcobinamide kinase/adenosylcobinamide-phosphate guanylyltransferase